MNADDFADRDRDLATRLAAHDENALAELYDLTAPRLFSLALAITGDSGEAEETVSDTFLHMWRKASTFDPRRGSLEAWAMAAVRSRALDRRRRATRRDRIMAEQGTTVARFTVGDHAEAPDTGALARADFASLADAIVRLDDDQRRAIELAYFGGLTQREIAQELGIPLGTVKTRIRNGMNRLRDAARRAGMRKVKA